MGDELDKAIAESLAHTSSRNNLRDAEKLVQLVSAALINTANLSISAAETTPDSLLSCAIFAGAAIVTLRIVQDAAGQLLAFFATSNNASHFHMIDGRWKMATEPDGLSREAHQLRDDPDQLSAVIRGVIAALVRP